ncbi:hypothetical protein [Agromyces archimandritae]|uniref:DUF3558 domain-containing protein n=1 Tax=Agromyces archimandritae TaxID=2781962 RepID=A0A975FNC4_9MICO|nr:hypothetical protein [Agromyces archimandritae]QTX05111.1 hypothetical protein G127AT_02415 [Agromyces archimandritae]
MTHRRPAFALVVLTALVLTACSSPEPRPIPSGTAEPSEQATPERPYPAFGGDCAAVLGADEVRAATGVDAEVQSLAPYAQIWAVASLGGLSCRWGAGQAPALSATVMPASFADEAGEGRTNCYDVQAEGGVSQSCSFSSIAGDWWFAGVVTSAPGMPGTEAVELVTAAFAERAGDASPETPTVPAGAWRTDPEGCGELDAEVDAAGTLGSPGLTASRANGAAGVGPGVYGAMAESGYVACIWEGGTGEVPGFSIEVVPGAGWALDDVMRLPDAVETEVAGADRAIVASPVAGAELEYLYLTDGVNLLIVEPTYDGVGAAALEPLVPGLVAALAG